MSGLEGARCAGRWWLFDSTDRRDHIAARQLCADCPAIAGCRELLQEALTAPCVQAGSGPIGTWAGLLFGRVGQKGVAEEAQLPGINTITGKAYTSRADITENDAKEVIRVLKLRPDAEMAGAS